MLKKAGCSMKVTNTFYFFSAESDGLGFTAFLLTALSVFLILVTVPFSLCLVVKVSNKLTNYLKVDVAIKIISYRGHFAKI